MTRPNDVDHNNINLACVHMGEIPPRTVLLDVKAITSPIHN